MIPLHSALLCVGCEHIVLSRTDACPLCLSTGLMPLANVLGLVNTSRELVQVSVSNSDRKEVAGVSPEHTGLERAFTLL